MKTLLEPPTKPKLTWKTAVFPILGLVGFFIYIYFYKVDILGILATAQNLDPLVYGVAIVFGLLEVLFFTGSWKVLTNYLQIKVTIS